MTECTYMDAQERITGLALEYVLRARQAATLPEKTHYMGLYQGLCDGAIRLRNAYQRTLQKKERQHVSTAN